MAEIYLLLLVVVLGGCELHFRLFLAGLGERHLALLHRAVEQKPGRELHQPRREPHAFGGIRERGIAAELLRFLPARAVEIGGGLLHERHAVAEQVGKGLRSRDPLAERNEVLDRLLGHRPRLTLRTRCLLLRQPLARRE